MRNHCLMITIILSGGCATYSPPAGPLVTAQAPAKPLVCEAPTTRVVETRYEVRSYHDSDSPDVRHEAHAVYRATRVPARVEALETMPRSEFAPVTYAPLPPNAELAAELAAQKEIGADLRAIQSRMAGVEQQARTQLANLANQTAETVNLRRQLEEERTRVRQLEATLREPVPEPVATPAASNAPEGETKW